jgi:glycerol-3-phosphate acyltransferase PlsY
MAIFLLILSLLILKKTKMASFSVLIVAFFSLFTIFIPGLNYCFLLEPDIKKLILLTTVSIEQISLLFAFQTIGFIIILIKHKENIKRIINKEERLLSLKKTS